MQIINQLLKHTKTNLTLNHPSMSDNTQTAYLKGWYSFQEYCTLLKTKSLPASISTVQNFLEYKASNLALSSLGLYLSAINKIHILNGYPSFSSYLEIQDTLKGLARCNHRPIRRVKALLSKDLTKILNNMQPTLIQQRDAALLAIGFAAALRRSELCDLKYSDIEFINNSKQAKMLLHIRRSKTDQAGKGYVIGIIDGQHINPIKHLKTYLKASQIDNGYLFRSILKNGVIKSNPLHHSDVSRLIKYYAASIGLDAKDYSGHSLRSGFITSAAIYKARLDKIMEVSRHKSTDMVMTYTRTNNIFDDHAGQDFI